MKSNTFFHQTHSISIIPGLIVVALLIASSTLKAQLCSGSLGDPVVIIDFGSGTTTHGYELGSSITSYVWTTADFPTDGYYTIESSTNTPGTWWTTNDHTGGGYMMVVNASFSITDYFYKKTVDGLCPNTTYEFAAWIMNLLRYNDTSTPDITFTIETAAGDILNSYSTGDIPRNSSAKWKHYGFNFTTPDNISSVVIRMRNNKVGAAPGNDIALDDITFRPCGPDVAASIASETVTSKELCADDKAVFTFLGSVGPGYSAPAYQWQQSSDAGVTWVDIAGATDTIFTRQPTSPGTYWYRMSTAQGTNISSIFCRVVSNILIIKVDANPVTDASSNDPACLGENLQLSSAPGGAIYQWTGPDNFTSSQQNPEILNLTSAQNGTYHVKLTTSLGCSSIDSVYIEVNSKPTADAGSDVQICEGTSVLLSGSGGETYLWQPATGISDSITASPVASPVDSTSYILKVSNGNCSDYDTINVFVWKKPRANAGEDQKIYDGTSVQLAGIISGTDVTFYWSPEYNISETDTLSPVVTPSTDTTYTLHVISGKGCEAATDDVFIRVYKKVTVPNAFSPNNDEINDTWKIDKLNTYPESETNVFNRYGQNVFHCAGYDTEWDGKYNGLPLPVGTYYYTIDLKTGLGNPSGWVVILR
jgi:gliding motility-associated-like protein